MFSNAFLLMKVVLLEVTLRWSYLILTKKVSNETVKSISNFSLGGQPFAVQQGNISLEVVCLVWVR